MAKNTSFSLSEVIHARLRALEEKEDRFDALRAAIDEGDSSGFEENFSIEDVLTDMRQKKR